MKPFRLFRHTTGLNTAKDPSDLKYDPETASIELCQCVNAEVSESGKRISRRGGRELLLSGESHSGFAGNGRVFCVRETPAWASLYEIDPANGSAMGIRSGLTKGRKMAYGAVNELIYYSNGVENGIIDGNTSRAWIAQDEYVGPVTDEVFIDAPVCNVIAIIGGFMLLGVGPIVWSSVEFDYHRYTLANRYLDLVDDVTMIAPFLEGAWVGTTRETLYMSGKVPSEWDIAMRIEGGVKSFSRSHGLISGLAIGLETHVAGYLWIGETDVYWGGPGGQYVPLTKKRIPSTDLAGLSGYCQLIGSQIHAGINP